MPNSWEDRFPNPHTRPDLDDELIKKVRRDSKEIFGTDPLEEDIPFLEYIERLRAKQTTPEFQAIAAERRAEDEAHKARQLEADQRRQMERLSPFHVDAVRVGCNRELRPITTTDIQRKVLEQWDGVTSMFLLGQTLIGKTYTATWCAMRAIRAGKSAASVTATRVADSTFDGLLQLRSVGLLVLDQLHTLRSPSGREMPAWKVSPVIDLIDYRYEHKLTTIGAGTIAPEAMVDLLGEDVKRRFPVRISSKITQVRP